MRKILSFYLSAILLAGIVCSCNDRLDITQNYNFDLQTMPYAEKIMQGETIEIRCILIKEGDFAEAQYFIRYFQPAGKGELRLDNGRLLIPNDLFLLTKDEFRLYYTSLCTDRQTIDVYIENNFGKVVQKTFAFYGE